MSSTPLYREYVPLPHQYDVHHAIREEYDYSLGTHEILMSGSVGSAKSMAGVNEGVEHVLKYPGANLGVGRLALPDLKATFCTKIKEHVYNIGAGLDFKYNESTGNFKVSNGSKISARSWHDGNFSKLGSYEYSSFIIEELTENKGKYEDAYKTITQRVGRLKIPQKFILSLTNPDGPSHWAYKYFIKGQNPTRHVFYSLTTDNLHLPDSYIRKLGETLDPKMYERMVKGRWIDLKTEVIYYQYSDINEINQHMVFQDPEDLKLGNPPWRHIENYQVSPYFPQVMSCDFNIGEGKPMSFVFCQHVNGSSHFYGEVIVDGARTREAVIEAIEKKLIVPQHPLIVDGDASGYSKDTRHDGNDYSIIEDVLKDYGFSYQIRAPRKNPAIKIRHALVNGRCKNKAGQPRLFVYKGAPTVRDGLSLTKLKPGANFIEDDGPNCPYQHCSTAVGYTVCADHAENQAIGSDYLESFSKYG